MRDLHETELTLVTGAGDTKDGPNNNGYGNGAEGGPAPGKSGKRNPQLDPLNPNLGPRGPR